MNKSWNIVLGAVLLAGIVYGRPQNMNAQADVTQQGGNNMNVQSDVAQSGIGGAGPAAPAGSTGATAAAVPSGAIASAGPAPQPQFIPAPAYIAPGPGAYAYGGGGLAAAGGAPMVAPEYWGGTALSQAGGNAQSNVIKEFI